jgi:hypothetical protein
MRSGFEEDVRRLLKSKKIKFEYETVSIPYTVSAVYKPDFIIGKIHIETKGWLRPSDRKKLLLVKKQNPDLDIRLWFMQDNFLNKNKKTKYSEWADKNGFPYHVGLGFPKHWFTKKK